MIAIRVCFADPSKLRGNDAFAIVGAQLKLNSSSVIEYKLAKQFWNGNYSTVAKYMTMINDKVKPNFFGMETNNDGKDILSLFNKKYKMTWLKGVSTSNNLKVKTRQMGFALDKNFMMNWIAKKKAKHEVLFPSVPSKDMEELIDQFPKMVAMQTMGGKTTYKAHRGQHDDLFMGALHCANYIRLFIEQQARLK